MHRGVWLATPMGLQRIDHDLATEQQQCALIMERSRKYIVEFFFFFFLMQNYSMFLLCMWLFL